MAKNICNLGSCVKGSLINVFSKHADIPNISLINAFSKHSDIPNISHVHFFDHIMYGLLKY